MSVTPHGRASPQPMTSDAALLDACARALEAELRALQQEERLIMAQLHAARAPDVLHTVAGAGSLQLRGRSAVDQLLTDDLAISDSDTSSSDAGAGAGAGADALR